MTAKAPQIGPNWKNAVKASAKCFFCGAVVSMNTSSHTSYGFTDRLDCEFCGTPVCDECGFTDICYEDNLKDFSYRRRICKHCMEKKDTPRDRAVPHYCMVCCDRFDEPLQTCFCERAICKDCAIKVDDVSLCPVCYTKYQKTRLLCASCEKELFEFQTPKNSIEKYYRQCAGCKKKFCSDCCKNERFVVDRFCFVCDECLPNYPVEAEKMASQNCASCGASLFFAKDNHTLTVPTLVFRRCNDCNQKFCKECCKNLKLVNSKAVYICNDCSPKTLWDNLYTKAVNTFKLIKKRF